MDKPAAKIERAQIETLLGLDRSGASGLRRRLLRYAAWLVAAALFLGLLYLWVRDAGPAPVYVLEPVTRRDLTVVVTATGTIEPTEKVDVSSELSGIIRRVLVDYNSVVKVGDVLAELDTDKLETAVARSRANLVVARAQVQQAKATVEESRLAYERKKALVESRTSSQQDFDIAKASYDRARAALAAAEADIAVAAAQLASDETDLNKARIVSPIEGVILSRHVDPGQTVASSFQAPILFTIAGDLKEMEVQVDVDEADVGQVREGEKATFSVDAYPDRIFHAEIKELRFGSEVVQGVITYKAVLTADNSDMLLRPGMTATAIITVDEVKDALTVPNAALRYSPPVEESAEDGGLLSKLLPRMPRFRPASPIEAGGGDRTVWVLENGLPIAVPVVVGVSDGQRTQILEGEIAVGKSVIVDSATPAE